MKNAIFCFTTLLVLTLIGSCANHDAPIPECTIDCIAGKWYLEGIQEKADSFAGLPPGSKAAFLLLADTMHSQVRDGLYLYPYPYSGIAMINLFFGTYNTSIQGDLEMAGPATTYIGGPKEWMDYENRFYQGLRTANRFEVFPDDRLIIYSDSLPLGMHFMKE